MKKLLAIAFVLLIIPACELLDLDVCGGGPPYFDVEGVNFSAANYGQPVNYRYAGLYFTLTERYYSAHLNGYGSAAYACQPTEYGYEGTKERLDSLVFTSRYDYDVQHPAGTSLNDILRVTDIGEDSLLTAEFGRDLMALRHLSLSLRVPPTQAGPQQFVVQYWQTNGEHYTAETKMVELTP